MGELLTSFMAGRARQATLVRPELIEPRHTVQRLWQGQRDVHLGSVVEPDEGRGELGHESVIGVTRIQHDSKYGLLVALGVNVHEMKLSAGAVVVDRVVRRGVDVPAGQIHGLVVVRHRREVGVGPFGVLNRERRAVSPVPEASRRLVGIVEGGDVVEREAVVEAERDWGLLGSSLAKFVL